MRYLIIFLFLCNYSYAEELIIYCKSKTTDFTRNGKIIKYTANDIGLPSEMTNMKYKIDDKSKKLYWFSSSDNEWNLIKKDEFKKNFELSWSESMISWRYESIDIVKDYKVPSPYRDLTKENFIDRITGEMIANVYFGKNSDSYKRDGTTMMKQKFECKKVKNKF